MILAWYCRTPVSCKYRRHFIRTTLLCLTGIPFLVFLHFCRFRLESFLRYFVRLRHSSHMPAPSALSYTAHASIDLSLFHIRVYFARLYRAYNPGFPVKSGAIRRSTNPLPGVTPSFEISAAQFLRIQAAALSVSLFLTAERIALFGNSSRIKYTGTGSLRSGCWSANRTSLIHKKETNNVARTSYVES